MSTAHAGADEAAESLRLIGRAIAHETSLRSRTEGLTWMAWGVVLAAIFLMYAASGPLSEDAATRAWLTLLWVPWVLAGAAFTAVLWRTAALGRPLPRPAAGWRVTALWIGAIVAAFGALSLAPSLPNPESGPVVAVGLAWLLMGAPNLFRATPEGRRAVLVIGGATALAGVALALLLPAPDYHAPSEAAVRFGQDAARALAVLAAPFLVGLRQALRG